MNWTGGRLQRHSQNPVQRKKFTRPKRQNDKRAGLNHIKDLSQLRETDGPKGLQQRTAHGHDPVCISGSSNLQSPSVPVTDESSKPISQSLSRLDRIKRQLLETNDWAAVSATRPVKMPFTPSRELERFGKRRRLTEADRGRLVDSSSRSRPAVPGSTQECIDFQTETIGKMDIRIHHPHENKESSKTDPRRRVEESSQPMLLDRADSRHGADGSPAEDVPQQAHSSQLLLSSEGLGPDAARQPTSLFPPSTIGSPIPELASSGRAIDASPPCQLSRPPTRAGNNSPNILQPIPQFPRRFTLDDQIAAELEGNFNVAPSPINAQDEHTNPRQADTANSYVTSESSSENARSGNEPELGTQSTSSNLCTEWLPEPTHRIHRFVQEGPRHTPIAPIHTPLISRSAELTKTSTFGSLISPVKLFGQSVALDNRLPEPQYQEQLPFSTRPQMFYSRPRMDCTTPSHLATREPASLGPKLFSIPPTYKAAQSGNQHISGSSMLQAPQTHVGFMFTPFRRNPEQTDHASPNQRTIPSGQQIPLGKGRIQ